MKRLKLSLILFLVVFVITGGVYATWIYNININPVEGNMNAEFAGKEVYGGGNIIIDNDINRLTVTIDQKDSLYHAKALISYTDTNGKEKTKVSVKYDFGKNETRTDKDIIFRWYVSVAASPNKNLDDLIDGKTITTEKLFKYTQSTLPDNLDTVTLTPNIIDKIVQYKIGHIEVSNIQKAIDSMINESFTLDNIKAYDDFMIKWNDVNPIFTLHIM